MEVDETLNSILIALTMFVNVKDNVCQIDGQTCYLLDSYRT